MSEKGIENHQRYQNQQRNSENAGKHKVESHSGVRYHYPPSHHRRTQRHNSGTSTASTNSAATLSNLTNNKSGKWDGRLIPSRVFVGNIPPNLVERDLGLLFCRFGKIRDVKIIPDSSRSKSYGFVTFFSEVDAKRAIQASLQQDAVMWGDRKLNVAPAVKRQNKNCPSIRASTESLFSLWTPRFGGTTYFSNPLHASTPALFQTEGTDTTGTHTPQPPPVVNANNNGMYKGSFFCRYPHQLPTPQYPHWSSSPTGAHYFMTPSFQPYVQNGNTPVVSPSAYSTAQTCNSGQDNNLPMTSYHNEISVNVSTTTLDKSCEHHGSGSSLDSSGSSSNTITEGLSQLEVGEGETEQPYQGKVDGNELAVQEDGSQQVYTSDNINNNNPVCQPLHQTAMICCAHHSCMMSPLPLPMVPAYHLGGQMSSTRSSCVSLNSPSAPPNSPGCYPTGTPFVPYGSNLPGVYNQPHYRPNSNPPRLQRWNSMDAGIYQHQDHASMLSHEMGWTRQVVLNDSYGSEIGLHYLPVRQQYPTISAFPCTAHGLVSPFCRSYDSINVLGQGQHYQHYGEQMEQINVSMTSLNCKK